ncbi:MAG: sulfatase-like hydrolase/transferase [Pseudomonadales bacterium]|nr:sulfatase-like hydrolase/transferase [Pseudomonadales bacterium]
MKRPSFLFLITDQHRADHVGFGGNDVVRTPHLDGLASRGVVFDEAYVANPICMPNRSSIMTGRMPSVHGTRFNGISLDWRANTFVRRLRSAGYRTTHIGKSHLQNICINRSRIERLVDFTLAEEALLPSLEDGWNELENYSRYRAGDEPEFDDFYGFERAAFAILHGDQVTGHYEGWLKQNGLDPDRLQGPANALERYEGFYQIYKTAIPEAFHPSSYVALKTMEELSRAARDDRPFFIHASWPDPHHPFTPPGDYYDMYSPSAMRLPETFDDPHTDSMPHYKQMVAHRGEMLFHNVDGWAPTRDQFRHALAAEYGAISLIDDGIGRILETLEREGLADDTIVVFTSDHGDMFGDHGIMFKHAMHYRGCLRVPLVVSGPDIVSRRTARHVSSIDIPSTILDLAGVDGFYGMQGRSFAHLLAGSDDVVRDHIYIEEDEKEDMTGGGTPTRMRTLVCDQGRLTIYDGHDHGELFAGDDPQEMNNLFSKKAGADLRHWMTETLLRQVVMHAETSPRPTHNA